ncbi:hypothetical protein EDB67_10985 [Vibrio crassostreae]|nr:hypothetical protein EDB67_10985 [Vibrio crassostreae]
MLNNNLVRIINQTFSHRFIRMSDLIIDEKLLIKIYSSLKSRYVYNDHEYTHAAIDVSLT